MPPPCGRLRRKGPPCRQSGESLRICFGGAKREARPRVGPAHQTEARGAAAPSRLVPDKVKRGHVRRLGRLLALRTARSADDARDLPYRDEAGPRNLHFRHPDRAHSGGRFGGQGGLRFHQVGSGKSNAGCAEMPASVDGRGQGEAMAILCPVPAMEHGPRSFVTKGVSGSGSAIVEVRAQPQLLGR